MLVGPLIDEAAGEAMDRALKAARAAGGTVYGGGWVMDDVPEGGVYVRPAIVDMPDADAPIIKEETFAPILYVLGYDTLDEAIALHNDVPQGLSSAMFTSDMREAETFLSPAGSDCGIANVNIGTRPAAAASPAPTPGRPTCAAPPTRSTTPATCRWPRASDSMADPNRIPRSTQPPRGHWRATMGRVFGT